MNSRLSSFLFLKKKFFPYIDFLYIEFILKKYIYEYNFSFLHVTYRI